MRGRGGDRLVKSLTIDEAAGRRWDVIVVGTSFAAMFFARGLQRNHRMSVLFVERGPFVSREQQVEDPAARVYEAFSQNNTSGHEKTWVAQKMFGGNSNCWTGCVPRFHPNDFRMKSAYGVEVDWPITYAELEPYYYDVEAVMEVAGGGSDHHLPRDRPFPFPPHAPNNVDVVLRKHDPINWFAQPAARSNGGRRTSCCSNGLCHLCPVDAKFTILNSLEDFETDNTHYLLSHEVRKLAVEGGRSRGVIVRDKAGRETELGADLVGLGANAISNAAILMRTGVQNPHLGRGIAEQASRTIRYHIPFANFFGGTKITGHGYLHYDGQHRRNRAGVLMEIRNDLTIARLGRRGDWLNVLSVKFISDTLVNPNNRMILQDGEPHIEWVGYGKYALDGLDHAIDQSLGMFPFEATVRHDWGLRDTEAHIQGMTAMGRTADEGVTNLDGEVFGLPGVRVMGSGVFPTCSPANPTLTLAALALRAGERA